MKLYVWDLHGTLETGNERASVDVSNEVLKQFGHRERFTYEDGNRLYGLRWYEYFEFLLPDLTHEEHVELQEASFKLSTERPEIQYRSTRPTPHSRAVLDAVGQCHQEILISNTKPESLVMYLKLLEIEEFFPEGQAIAVDRHAPKAKNSKAEALASYLEIAGQDFDELVIVGDSPADMRLSEVAGGVRYLYTHPGFNFRECEADYRIRDLRCVLEQL